MRLGLVFLLCLSALAQGLGKREAMQPWLQGKFPVAEQKFAQMRLAVPTPPESLLWESEFEMERAQFGLASTLIQEAARISASSNAGLAEHHLARFYLATGRFAEAEKLALEGHRWNGKDPTQLKLSAAMDFVTLGEISLAKGDSATAIAILDKAIEKAKSISSADGLEWFRAQNDLTLAYLEQGAKPAALQAANFTYQSAGREWGNNSIPAMDALDSLALVRIARADFKNAEDTLTSSRAWREALYPPGNPKVALSYLHAAELAAAQEQKADALRLARRGLEIAKTTTPLNGAGALILLEAADILAAAGQPAEAIPYYDSALAVLEPALGHAAPRLERARQRRAALGGK